MITNRQYNKFVHLQQVAAKPRGGAVEDKAKGRMKEAAGAITGDEEKKAEGKAQQRKGEAGEEAAQRAKTRQTEKEAREAERERDRQRGKDKGLLGGLGDTLSGR
jgi:uncharacterized protein YjbJ (UPF0337 family)